ncbi:hypothetical protein QUC31_017517 [Theobroma cacao]
MILCVLIKHNIRRIRKDAISKGLEVFLRHLQYKVRMIIWTPRIENYEQL